MLQKVAPRNNLIQLQNKNLWKPFIKGILFSVTHKQSEMLTIDN